LGKSKKPTSKIITEKVATVFGLSELFDDPSLLLQEIGLESNRVYRKVPNKCYVCSCDEFSYLSILGVYNKPLFYECEECGALHLKYKQSWIEVKMLALKDAYINPEDWKGEPPKGDYN